MKITHVNDITEESLKTLQASSVKDFLSEEIKKASDSYVAEKSKVEEALKLAKTQATDINTKLEATQTELTKVKEDLKKLQDEKLIASQLEAFNKRMASLDEKYEFSDDMKKVIAAQVKACADDASFKSWEESMQVFFKAYDKASKQEALKKEQAAAAAAKTPETVVAKAVEGAAAKQENTTLPPNAALASSKSKWADALKEESIIIK
jgi:predicted nuclease with TOPRIM domain